MTRISAGMSVEFVWAIVSHMTVGDLLASILLPILIGILLILSWACGQLAAGSLLPLPKLT